MTNKKLAAAEFGVEGEVGCDGVGPEAFGEVFVGGVAEDGDDGGFAAGGVFGFGDLEGGGYGGGGGDTDEQALVAAEPLGHGVGALGGHVDVRVG